MSVVTSSTRVCRCGPTRSRGPRLFFDHTPLYVYFVAALTAIGGPTELIIRSTTLVFGLLTVLLVYRIGLELRGVGSALVGSMLVALNPFFATYSWFIRMEVPLCFFLVLALYLLIHERVPAGRPGDRGRRDAEGDRARLLARGRRLRRSSGAAIRAAAAVRHPDAWSHSLPGWPTRPRSASDSCSPRSIAGSARPSAPTSPTSASTSASTRGRRPSSASVIGPVLIFVGRERPRSLAAIWRRPDPADRPRSDRLHRHRDRRRRSSSA